MYKRDLGQVAFEAYAKSMGGKTYDNKPIPEWDNVSPNVRRGWQRAAEAVKQELVYQTASVMFKEITDHDRKS
jgi:hypothetical protein